MSGLYRSFKSAARVLTRREQVEMALADVNGIMRSVLGDPLGPTKVLADGKQAWINAFLDAMRGHAGVDREMAEFQWLLFEQEHARRFPGDTPAKVLDDTHVRSDTTAKEIREAFKHDSASSREMRKEVYGPDDYDVDNAARQAADSLTDEELKPSPPTIEDIAKGLPRLLADTEPTH
jgi:hypothetical protein